MADLAVVVGGTGFVGRHVVEALRDRGVDTVSAGRHGADVHLDLAARGAPGAAWDAVAARATHVVLSVGSPQVGQSLTSLAVHFDGVERLLHLLERCPRATRVVMVSSVLVYGDADAQGRAGGLELGQQFSSRYAYAKYRGEQVLARSPVPFRVARPGLVLGEALTGTVPPGQLVAELLRTALALPALPVVDGGRFPAWTVPVDSVGRDVCALALDDDVPDVALCVDRSSPTLAALLGELLRPFGRVPLIVDPGRRAAPRALLAQALGRTGVDREWLGHARPWARLGLDDVARHRQGLDAVPGGYVELTARYLRDAYL